jgi:hypothetical protein
VADEAWLELLLDDSELLARLLEELLLEDWLLLAALDAELLLEALLPGALEVEELKTLEDLLLDAGWLLDWLAGALSPVSPPPPPPPQATSIRLSRRALQVRRGVRINKMEADGEVMES